jgi:hypothetical protein
MRRLLVSLTLAAIALLALPALASAQNDVARGSGFTLFSFPQQFSFNAQSNFNGSEPSGSVSFTDTNTDPNQTFKGRVTCLSVVGNVATMSGPITDVQGFPVFGVVNSFVLTATDTGKFGVTPDLVRYFTTSAPPAPAPTCVTFTGFVGQPIQSGEIVIKDSNS